MRLQSSVGYQTVYVNVPDGSFASNSCPTGYTYARVWDEQGRYQVDVCMPAPQAPAPPPPPPPAPVYNNINTVSPNIQVSPQISPVFQQQFQPTNSPATAGTQQSNYTPPPQPTVAERPQYAPPPAYVPPPPPPRQIDYTTPAVVTNQPPPPASLPPATGTANVAFEAQPIGAPPPLSTLLNNPNIANADDDSAAATNAPAVATGSNSKLIGIGLAALLALVLLTSKKRKK